MIRIYNYSYVLPTPRSCVVRILTLWSFILFYANTGYCQPNNLYTKITLPNKPVEVPAPENNDPKNEDDFDREELPIMLNVQRIGSLEIPAIIVGHKAYLSVKDIFDFLKIRNTPSNNFDSISGFFIEADASYLIEKTNNRIVYQGKEFKLDAEDLLQTPTALFLRSDKFGQIFGLECNFDFRSLSVNLTTKIELPAIREMQQELMRRNISQLKGEKKADTTIRRQFSMFRLGMADWSLISTQEGGRRTNTRAYLGLGALVAGGELNLLLNYNSDDTLNMRQQLYQWRYVNNDHAALRQITTGKIFAQSISSLYAPVIGVQLSNISTVYRRSYGSYTISNTTEPNWTVELYINNVLVNYTKADASGFYTFEVPMVYGNSLVKLRFYGPWGEERVSEKYISVPFNFTPLHQFEYNVIAGVVDNDQKSKSLRAAFNYGLSRGITIGGGLEYLSSVTSGPSMPFVNASFRLGTHTLFSAEHIKGVKSRGVLSYRLPSEMQLELNYIRYEKNQTAILTNFLDEKKLMLSLPLRTKKFSAFSRLSVNQFTLAFDKGLSPQMSKYTSAEWLLSSVVAGISSNLTTYAILNKTGNPLVYTNLALNFYAPKGIRIMPQAQYEYRQNNFSMVKLELEKSIFNRGFVNITFQKSFINNFINNYSSSVTLGLRYNFSFAQVFTSGTRYKHTFASTQAVRGSLLYDGNTNYMGWNNQSGLRRGGFIVLPFLDLNNNGHRDANEPKAFGLKLHTNGGRTEYNTADTTIRITGLEAYASYYIELEKNSFDNLAWQVRYPTISATAESNSFRLIEVPVMVMGEVSGTVYLKSEKETKGLERIIVNIYNSSGNLVAHTLTESDGFFDFIGLAPGDYTARVDEAQLAKLSMQSSATMPFTITKNTEGDIVNNLKFVLQVSK